MVFWLECPDKPFEQDWTFRLIDDEILGSHYLITGDVDLDGKLDLIANSGRPADTLPQFHRLAPSPQKPKSEHPGHAMFCGQRCSGRLSLPGVRRRQPDGIPDVACGAKGGKVSRRRMVRLVGTRQRYEEFLEKRILSDKQPGASNILPGDLDGDGLVDYLASRGHGKGVLWFKAEANSIKGGRFSPDFKPIEIDPIIDRPHSLALADMDQDGDLDAATCGSLQPEKRSGTRMTERASSSATFWARTKGATTLEPWTWTGSISTP